MQLFQYYFLNKFFNLAFKPLLVILNQPDILSNIFSILLIVLYILQQDIVLYIFIHRPKRVLSPAQGLKPVVGSISSSRA
jgi:hypothetical protein